MSSVFEAVKAAVPVRAAAERYGLEVSFGGMVRCPFHEDHTPSMKLYEDHFYCFGCGKHGDVISLVAELFAIPPYDAACKLADDFGVDTNVEIVRQPAIRTCVQPYTNPAEAFSPGIHSEKRQHPPGRTHVRMYG